MYPDVQKHIDIVIEEKIPIVFTSAGNPDTWTGVLKEKGIKVVHVVSSSRFARKADEAGCDAVVAEGFEAGGHNGREETTSMVLIPAVVDAVQIPVIAAGGIGNRPADVCCHGPRCIGCSDRYPFCSESKRPLHIRILKIIF